MDNKLIELIELNSFVVCGICNGYLIRATTITECMHSCKWIIQIDNSNSIFGEILHECFISLQELLGHTFGPEQQMPNMSDCGESHESI